jgi:DNA-binding NarL/FixJ family response regulator
VTRVLVAAASAVTRAGLEAILSREPAFTIVGSGSGLAASVAEEIVEHEPDVVLVEVVADDDEHTLTMLHVLSSDADDGARPSPALVVLTEERDSARIGDVLRSGVRALLPRDASAPEINAAVAAAAAGLITVAGEWVSAARELLRAERGVASGTAPTRPDRSLTPRELEVLRMIADGLGNKQIAARLAISEHTVKFHVGSVFAKIHASTRAEAVMIGARRGLIVV